MTEALSIRKITVEIGNQSCGVLERNSQFAFTYADGAPERQRVSLTMPVKRPSYFRGALFPIFEMNLPEGYVRRTIHERMRKHAVVDEMLFLALDRGHGIGRLSYRAKTIDAQEAKPINLDKILHWDGAASIFDDLVDQYLLQTTAGVSGVQAKVLVPEQRGALTLPMLIIKTGDDQYPGLAITNSSFGVHNRN